MLTLKNDDEHFIADFDNSLSKLIINLENVKDLDFLSKIFGYSHTVLNNVNKIVVDLNEQIVTLNEKIKDLDK